MKRGSEYKTFLSWFKFQKEMVGFVGIERERFLTTVEDGIFVPRAKDFLSAINNSRWTYELSACQVEDRTNPLKDTQEIKKALHENDCRGQTIAKQLGLCLRTVEAVKDGMPLAVYPDPRYLRIKSEVTRECLSAACRVAATHLHFGMPDIDTAIQVANLLRKHLKFLCGIGDHSNGERLQLYKTMALCWMPPHYRDEKHFFEVACKEGFVENPRDCWHLIRISIHGTVELRMFGVTEDLDEICAWIRIVREIIAQATNF